MLPTDSTLLRTPSWASRPSRYRGYAPSPHRLISSANASALPRSPPVINQSTPSSSRASLCPESELSSLALSIAAAARDQAARLASSRP